MEDDREVSFREKTRLYLNSLTIPLIGLMEAADDSTPREAVAILEEQGPRAALEYVRARVEQLVASSRRDFESALDSAKKDAFSWHYEDSRSEAISTVMGGCLDRYAAIKQEVSDLLKQSP